MAVFKVPRFKKYTFTKVQSGILSRLKRKTSELFFYSATRSLEIIKRHFIRLKQETTESLAQWRNA